MRRLICGHYREKYKLNVSIDNIAVTAGASAAIFMALLSLFDKDDVVALARPGYPAYRNIVKALDMKVHYINTEIKNNFQLTPKLVKALPKNIKGIIVSSPSNPCGSIISNNDMREITEICKRKNIRVISDEIYHKVEYDNKKLDTAFKMDSSSIVINSFSKYFLMTGYRLGWVLGDKKFINRIRNLSMNFYLSPSSISQHVGQTVFRYYDYFDEVVLSYLENRNFLINALNNIGLSNFILPKGAFYIYLDSSKVHKNSYDFCKKMVNDIGVTAAPGIDFDDLNGKNYLRLSYSCSRKDLEEGINRIKEWI